MDKGKIAETALEMIPDVIRLVKDLVAKGRTKEEILEHIVALGPAARADVDAVALATAAEIRAGQS